jgi:hypothetical protein
MGARSCEMAASASPRTAVRHGRRAFTLLSFAVIVLGLVSAPAKGDCCMGPPVAVALPLNTPLTSTLLAVVSNDDPDHPGTGSVHVLLNVGAQRIADLGTFRVSASTLPTELAIPVPDTVRSRARAAGRRKRLHSAVVKFVVTASTPGIALPARTYGIDGYLTLDAPAVTRGATRIDLSTTRFTGAVSQHASGAALMATPHGWPRTSRLNAAIATFGPLPIAAGCRVNVEARPVAVATSRVAAFVAQEAYGVRLAASRTGDVTWAVWRSTSTAGPQVVKGLGIVRVARRRYVGLRVYAKFSPRCGPDAGRGRATFVAVRHSVRDMTVLPHRARLLS